MDTGQQEAHKEAREMLSNPDNCQKPPSRWTAIFPTLQASTPPSLELLADELKKEGNDEEYDYEEAIAKAHAEQHASLRLCLPEDLKRMTLPSRYNWWATVMLRRIRTNTAVTPHIKARFCQQPDSPDN